MSTLIPKTLLLRLILLALATAATVAFPMSQMGYGTLNTLAWRVILPAGGALLVIGTVLHLGGNPMAVLLRHGALAGTVATLALEAVRYPAFLAGFMPGNLPQLMGVLLLDRFALGPSWASDVTGFAYHFWMGASFGMIFTLLTAGRSRGWAVPYGVSVGVGFMVSPVVQALGVGVFGRDFGWQFAATVMTAHLAFGMALALALTALSRLAARGASRLADLTTGASSPALR